MPEQPHPPEEKQCRICFDNAEADPDLGRLIRPCLCKGSISYVHVRCLDKWRKTSQSNSAFFSCPQCHYKYRFARTKMFGIATNPIIVGGFSGFLFTLIVMLCSFFTTIFIGSPNQPYYISPYFRSPIDVLQDFVRAVLRILEDEGILDDFEGLSKLSSKGILPVPGPQSQPGLLKRLILRFLLGLPVVSAGSVLHMLFSAGLAGPLHGLFQFRGRRRRGNSRDVAALVIVGLLMLGVIRAVYKVYQFTQKITQRLLLRAEDAILEVNE